MDWRQLAASGVQHPTSEIQQALNVAARLENRFAYTPNRGWLIWNGTTWDQDTMNRVAFYVRHLIQNDATCGLWTWDERGEPEKITATLSNAEAVLKACESDPRLAVE